MEHISRTKSTQSGVSFLKLRPKIPAASCLFYVHRKRGGGGGGDERAIAGRGADVKRKKSKVTVCLDFYLSDLRYHVLPDAELGLILR